MHCRVDFRCSVRHVPTAVLDRVRSRLREISHTLGAVSSSDSFWSSIAESPLYVDIQQWRFKYSIERDRKQFTVLEAIRVSDVPAVNSGRAFYKKQA
jgi:hypothetical protein